MPCQQRLGLHGGGGGGGGAAVVVGAGGGGGGGGVVVGATSVGGGGEAMASGDGGVDSVGAGGGATEAGGAIVSTSTLAAGDGDGAGTVGFTMGALDPTGALALLARTGAAETGAIELFGTGALSVSGIAPWGTGADSALLAGISATTGVSAELVGALEAIGSAAGTGAAPTFPPAAEFKAAIIPSMAELEVPRANKRAPAAGCGRRRFIAGVSTNSGQNLEEKSENLPQIFGCSAENAGIATTAGRYRYLFQGSYARRGLPRQLFQRSVQQFAVHSPTDVHPTV